MIRKFQQDYKTIPEGLKQTKGYKLRTKSEFTIQFLRKNIVNQSEMVGKPFVTGFC